MNISALKAFVKLAENNCDFGIHKELGIPRSSLWTFIDDLEKQTGLKFVIRRKRHNMFTEEADRFLPFAEQIIGLFEQGIEESLNAGSKELSGEILISTTCAVASTILMPCIRIFRQTHRCVNVKVIASDYVMSSTEWMADILLRPMEPKDYLERRWHFTYDFALFASAEYLEKFGIPETGKDLLNHSIIGYGEHPFSYVSDIDWHLKGRWAGLPKLTPSVTINSTHSTYLAAAEGVGICSATTNANLFYKGKLIRILPHIDGPSVKSHFCIRRKMGAKVRKLVDVFQEFFENYLIGELGVSLDRDDMDKAGEEPKNAA
ncbi:LysR family transcriptional regulator [Candidatus Hydrogenosomobacter endosymbioticus]|uniref:LysR family transcriptional regulator n=1 Tax=Candidatus Hydrogenosomobacter endosymbioticus TaxID=2558174 RepID=A0ABM7V9Q3_9PROT|nr:LysR family transcriptional regulator [Candidatus Hydrogenosomobacter endosymbioticus]BDB96197.1 LysR family transcriptional regulator [Candidatus Hydrogenosomobacter endosymbioticus]